MEDLHMFQFHFIVILVNVDRANIVPIKDLEKTELPKDTQQILYVHKRLKKLKDTSNRWYKKEDKKRECKKFRIPFH